MFGDFFRAQVGGPAEGAPRDAEAARREEEDARRLAASLADDGGTAGGGAAGCAAEGAGKKKRKKKKKKKTSAEDEVSARGGAGRSEGAAAQPLPDAVSASASSSSSTSSSPPEAPSLPPAKSAFSRVQPPLSTETLTVLNSLGFTNMTAVQQATLPLFLSHKDVAVEACTGSGKTIAFVVPIMELILRHKRNYGPPAPSEVLSIVIAPTRELARQIHDILSTFCAPHKKWLRVVPLLVGGIKLPSARIGSSYSSSSIDPMMGNVVVATPGRLHERMIHESSSFDVRKLEVLVLDEADCLLDMGFEQTLTSILMKLPKQRRTGLFSATQTKEVRKLVRAGMRNPVQIAVKVNRSSSSSSSSSSQRTPVALHNYFSIVDPDKRLALLLRFLRQRTEQKCIVFFATCASVDFFGKVVRSLLGHGEGKPKGKARKSKSGREHVFMLHGKMPQRKREAVYADFLEAGSGGHGNSGDGAVLICTDVAARGIDIPDVNWIVQYDPPTDPDFYVHRVGRTARAGRSGNALLLLQESERSYLDLLRMKRVPIKEVSPEELMQARPGHSGDGSDVNDSACSTLSLADASTAALSQVRELVFSDRDYLEKGTRAFVASMRAYKEHKCEFVFQFASLDLACMARAFCLLRVPKMKELRDGKIEGFKEEPQHVVQSIAFKDKNREKQRQIKLKEINAEKAKILAARKLLRKAKPKSEKDKAADALSNKKGKKRKKQSKSSRFWAETHALWDDVGEEERLAKRLRKGKITQGEFDAAMVALDRRSSHPQRTSKERRKGGQQKLGAGVGLSVPRGSHIHDGSGESLDGDEKRDDEVAEAKRVLREHTARVVAAKRKHRRKTRNIK